MSDGELFSQKWLDHMVGLERRVKMGAAFEAKEPVAAEHALKLVGVWMASLSAPNMSVAQIVEAYREAYRGILKALREGV